jgi:ubiquinone/menaquinone biosynthesis C-methylase UbiE
VSALEVTMSDSAVNHPLFARFWLWVSPGMERGGMARHRDVLLAGLAGRVIEVGAGNGLNFAHYPPEVTKVLAVEPNPHLRRVAIDAAARAPVPVEVTGGTADRLPAADADFDAAVASLVLCSVPDLPGALRELRRVIKPGGELRFLEHVRASTPVLRGVQRALDATVWPMLGGGCHLSRDTATEIETAGFTIDRLDRLRFPDTRLSTPSSPHIIGRAIRPPSLPP